MAMSAFYNRSRILQYLFTDYPIHAEPRDPDFYHGLLGAAKGVSAPQTVDVVLAEKAAPPVKSGAEELRHALEMRGLRVRVTSELTPRPGRSSRPGESCKFFRSGLS